MIENYAPQLCLQEVVITQNLFLIILLLKYIFHPMSVHSKRKV